MQSGQQQIKLPRLREDLKLQRGPQHRDGAPSWRILDPIRNRFFEIGWLEFELLARWEEFRDPAALITAVAHDTPLHPTEDEVKDFAAFLMNNQLVVPEGEALEQLRKRWFSAKKPWYETLFHNYLFFRIPLTKPDKFLDHTLPVVQLFYTRAFATIVLMVFLADLYLLSRDFTEVARSFNDLLSFQGGVYFLLAATFSKIIHEFGHAYTAKRYGLRVPAMGVAFLVMWPFLYTDTGETWKLNDRKKQFAIAASGIISELVIACFATFLWAITPDGPVKYMFFVLATTTWVMTLAINASPFMRFDGYFLLSDFLDLPNLHERSGVCARWWIRRTFFNLNESKPEPVFTDQQRFGLILFALITWIYRLTVFLGIAVLVYYAFYKPLGIVLMMLEIIWFVAKPIATELRYLVKKREFIRPALVPFVCFGAVVLLLVWLIPVAREVSAPAIMLAKREQSIYAPAAAQVISVDVKTGDYVQAGQLLMRMASPELEVRARKNEVALYAAKAEYLRGVATSRQQERHFVLLEQLNEALAEQQAVREEMDRLELRAVDSGVVRDMPADIVAGRWVNPRELLMRVVSDDTPSIEVYLNDTQIHAVELGQPVKFFPVAGGIPVLRGRVTYIARTGGKDIPRLLASTYGGEIPAVAERGMTTARHPVYRVIIEPQQEVVRRVPFATSGTARIQTDLVLVAQNFLWRMLSILVRESGI